LKRLHVPDYFYALAAMVFWGLSFIWTSLLLKYYQPITIIFFRLILSASFLFFIILLFRINRKIDRKDIPLVLLSAVFNPFFYFLGENYGLKYSSSTIASVIIATIPLFSPIVAYLFAREKLGLMTFTGIVISFGGIVIMLLHKGYILETGYLGILFLFGAVLASLFYSALLRTLVLKYSAVTLIGWQNLAGIFLFLPFFLIFDAGKVLSVPLNATIISSFLMLAIFASSMSFVFFAHSIKLIGINKSNIFSNLIPVLTAFFAFLFSLESFNIQKIIGIVLVIGGVFLSERTRPKS
jgi:drug/metabolite transporter (DMT)-like permease